MQNEIPPTTLAVTSEANFEMATTSGSLMLAGGAAFAHIQRVAKMFASSDLIPDAFKGKIPNCVIALEMAHRMGANPMAVMQNLYIVHGRPGWSAQFIIACLNQCGKFSPIRFDISGEGDKRQCIAKAKELESGEILEGPAVSIAMAKAEGWEGKNGSKWKTMPDLMLRYRAATFFGRLYAPDMLMGMQTAEELADTGERSSAATTKQPAKAMPETLPVVVEEDPSSLQGVVRGALEGGGFSEDDLMAVLVANGETIKGDTFENQSNDTLQIALDQWPAMEAAMTALKQKGGRK